MTRRCSTDRQIVIIVNVNTQLAGETYIAECQPARYDKLLSNPY